MRLADYLSTHRITQSAFAGRVGVTTSTISRLCRGQTPPSKDLISAIVRETGGAVLPNDLFPDAMAQVPAEAAPVTEAA
jgi:transcriptional regulator with XRE-family HTH domain